MLSYGGEFLPNSSMATGNCPPRNLDRLQQINTLKVFNDNVSVLVENSEYSVEFIAGETKFTMLIILGPHFPMDKPLLKITPSISHEWVNENSEVFGAPGYVNYSVYSDLGRVVQAIIREYQRNPPPLLHRRDPPKVYRSMASKESGSVNSSNENYKQSVEVMSSVVARLHKLNIEELNNMNKDDRMLEQFISELPHVVDLKQTVVDLACGTEEMQRENLELERKIEESRSLKEAYEAEFKNHKESFEKLYDDYSKLREYKSPTNVKKRLKQSISPLDEESEELAAAFLANNLPLESFTEQYKEIRKKVYSLKTKEEHIKKRLQNPNDKEPYLLR